MTKQLILDTNVFYDLAARTVTPSAFSSPGDVLYYSPISVLELVGKWSEKHFLERRAAARAILNSGAIELPDQDSFLAQTIFGYALKRPIVSLNDAVIAMAESRSLTSLRSGVENYFQKVVRTVNAEKVGLWRSIVEGLWVRDMLSIQEREVPGFATWYSDRSHYPERPVPRLKAAKKQEFLKKTREPNWDLTLAFYCHRRALLSARKNQPTVADSVALETISNAIKSLSCYCGVYTQYIVRLLTKSALPAFNDSGDIELFLHAVDDDHIVVTSEKKWETMAENAGFGNRVRMAK